VWDVTLEGLGGIAGPLQQLLMGAGAALVFLSLPPIIVREL
jgi:hypothetical protein